MHFICITQRMCVCGCGCGGLIGGWWGWVRGFQISRWKHLHVVLSVNSFIKQVYAMRSTRYPVFKSNAMLWTQLIFYCLKKIIWKMKCSASIWIYHCGHLINMLIQNMACILFKSWNKNGLENNVLCRLITDLCEECSRLTRELLTHLEDLVDDAHKS